VVIRGSEIHWADLGQPRGSAPAKRRPVVIVQVDPFNRSRLATVVVAVITFNVAAAEHPGNVFLPAAASRLPKDSAINVSAIVTLDRSVLDSYVGRLASGLVSELDAGLRTVLAVRR
jgi:mRNA interferase MazF